MAANSLTKINKNLRERKQIKSKEIKITLTSYVPLHLQNLRLSMQMIQINKQMSLKRESVEALTVHCRLDG